MSESLRNYRLIIPKLFLSVFSEKLQSGDGKWACMIRCFRRAVC